MAICLFGESRGTRPWVHPSSATYLCHEGTKVPRKFFVGLWQTPRLQSRPYRQWTCPRTGLKSESRLKSHFWPCIRTGSDLDYLGPQGFWVCALAAILSLVLLTISGKPIVGAFVFLFYFLCGVGVRERSLYAAAMIFLMYLADGIVSAPSVVRVLLAVLLLSNLRATRIASHSVPNSD